MGKAYQEPGPDQSVGERFGRHRGVETRVSVPDTTNKCVGGGGSPGVELGFPHQVRVDLVDVLGQLGVQGAGSDLLLLDLHDLRNGPFISHGVDVLIG